mgnify:CR=1 FL=1
MQVKLRWVNRNTLPTTTKIYRNTTDKPTNDLGIAIVELDGAVTEWLDTTAVRGLTYYYRFETTYETKVAFSMSIKVLVDYDNGPGPRELQYGDSELGYYGTLSGLEMFSRDEVLQAFPSLAQNAGPNPLPNWDKWIRNGQIIFVPQAVMAYSLGWRAIYAAGAMFGVDTTGPSWCTQAIIGTPPVAQSAKMSKGFYTYRVRVARGLPPERAPDYVASDLAVPDDRRGSEIADLFYPRLNGAFPTQQRIQRCATAGTSAEEFRSDPVGAPERYKTGVLAGIPSYTTATIATIAANVFTLATAWKPIFELDQTDLVTHEVVL